eukprot:scaffold3804_cov51-Attheya_sp.AAC.4
MRKATKETFSCIVVTTIESETLEALMVRIGSSKKKVTVPDLQAENQIQAEEQAWGQKKRVQDYEEVENDLVDDDDRTDDEYYNYSNDRIEDNE